jgi:hypothetical protein
MMHQAPLAVADRLKKQLINKERIRRPVVKQLPSADIKMSIDGTGRYRAVVSR